MDQPDILTFERFTGAVFISLVNVFAHVYLGVFRTEHIVVGPESQKHIDPANHEQSRRQVRSYLKLKARDAKLLNEEYHHSAQKNICARNKGSPALF